MRDSLPGTPILASATSAPGVDELRTAMVQSLLGRESRRDTAAISNARHVALLESARRDLVAARQAADGGMPEEFVLTDLQSARQQFDEVVGRRTTDDLLAHIFERFCIGK